MRNLYSTVIFFLLFLNTCYSQWPVIFGTEYYKVSSNHIRESYDKGFLITLDFQPQPSQHFGSCIIKTDINGNLLWKKQIGNPSSDINIRGLAMDSENNIYISGGTTQLDEVWDPFIMKVNPCMEVEWCNIYHSPELDDIAHEIIYMPSLNSFIVNLTYVRLDDNIRLMNIDTDGNIIWSNFYCSSQNYQGTAVNGLVHSTIDTSVVLYGYTYARIDTSLYFELEPYWLKINHQGDLIWEKYHLPDTAFFRGLTREEPIFRNQQSMITGLLSSAPDNNSQLVQLNYEDGAFQWITDIHQPDTSNVCVLNSVAMLNNFIYSGVQYFETGYGPEGNASLQKNDTLGNFIQETILPVDFTSIIEDICITHDEKILITATQSINQDAEMLIKYNQYLEYDTINTSQVVYDSLCPTTITSGTIELICNIITGLNKESKRGISTLIIAPNPANEYTIIYLPETIEKDSKQGLFDVVTYRRDYVKNLLLEVIDLYGQTIYSKVWPDYLKEQVLPISGWKSGIYLIRIHNKDRVIASGKLIVK